MSEAITPRDIRQMTIAEYDERLEAIRTRRMSYVEVLKKRSTHDGTVKQQEYQVKFDNVAQKIKKKFEKLDKDADALGVLINKLRVLELEYT